MISPGKIDSKTDDEFWNHRYTQKSTFGKAERGETKEKDDRFSKLNQAPNWKMTSEYGKTKSRVLISQTLGKLQSPGVGEYILPQPEILSNLENSPKYSISFREIHLSPAKTGSFLLPSDSQQLSQIRHSNHHHHQQQQHNREILPIGHIDDASRNSIANERVVSFEPGKINFSLLQ